MQYPELDERVHRSSPPPWIYSATEPARGAVEAAGSATLLPWLLQAPAGDGHTVIALPGFTASDLSTAPLRRYLQQLNYRTYGWSLGRNTGALQLQNRLVNQFLMRSDQAGTPISLIGQSMGGVFARELARRFPDRVRQVISLGSPFGIRSSRSTNPLVHHLFTRLSGRTAEQARARLQSAERASSPIEAPPVPCTAVYSRFDGVVAWQSCIERDRPNTSNIEVVGSHIGMTLHPAILHAITDRLAQAPDAWQRFDRSRGLRPLMFRKAQYAPG